MNRLQHIVFREWYTRVRRKAFILGTLLVPFLMAGLVGIMVWMDQSETEHHKVLIVDLAGLVSYEDSTLQAWVPICPDCFPERAHLQYRFGEQTLSDTEFLASDYSMMVFFDDGILQHHTAKFVYEKSPSMSVQSAVERDVSAAIERFKVKEELALDYATYKRLKTKVSLIGQDVVTKDGNAMGRTVIGFVFSLLMFIQIMVYGMHVMRGVIEEKANRIIEVVISVVRPIELMTGKIIGIGLVGVTQVVALVLLGFVIFQVGGLSLEMTGLLTADSNEAVGVDLQTWMRTQDELSFLLDVNWPLMIGAAVIYFIAGFFMYAAVFAAIGSAVEQESDAQYLMIPAMLPLLASYLIAAMAIENPEGQVALVGSFFPLTAPILMLIRLPLGVEWWEMLISISGVILTAYLLVRLSARIFRTGILMHGKRVSLWELLRWLRHNDRG